MLLEISKMRRLTQFADAGLVETKDGEVHLLFSRG